MKWKCLIFFFCFLPLFYVAEEQQTIREEIKNQNNSLPTLLISLRGHLDKELIEEARNLLELAKDEKKTELLIEIDSVSGDLQQVLYFCRKLYESKENLSCTVYIDGNAIGPAAIIPFLADRMIASPFLSWGSIGQSKEMPLNVLRNRVLSFIEQKHPQYETLRVLANGMIDPALKIFEDKAVWSINKGERLASPKKETLVVNHHQMRDANLVKEFVTRKSFFLLFGLESDENVSHSEEPQGYLGPERDLKDSLVQHIRYKDKKNRIGHIHIKKDGISQSTWIYVKSALDYYKKTKPIFIILELNTPGGEVFSSQQISDALKEMDTQYGIPVVAYINNWAVSAGAMLAYSSRFIAIAKDATMGAAEPVISGGEAGMQSASEKINSALRADFANRANFFGRNSLIAEAMVDKDMLLVLRNGKITKLEDESQLRLETGMPDTVISAAGKLLTLDAKSLIEYGVADLELPSKALEQVTEKELQTGSWPASKLALFQDTFFAKIPDAQIDAFQMDWKLHFFTFIASPAVSSLLFMAMMLCFYMEMNTPGFGIAGSLGLVCLSLLLLSSMALEAVSWFELILVIAGLSLLFLEILVIPGFGLPGIAGGILVLLGLFAMMLPAIDSVQFDFETESFNAAGDVFIEKLTWLCGSFVISILLIVFIATKIMPKTEFFKHLVLSGEENASDGFATTAALPSPGSLGKAYSTLRPAGKVIIEDEIFDAFSDAAFIEKGQPIEVKEARGNRLMVQSTKEDVS